MRLLLINVVKHRSAPAKGWHELHLDLRAPDAVPSNAIELVVFDAQSMGPQQVDEALQSIRQMKQRQPIGRVVMFWPNPPIETVVRALRSGVNEIIERAISGPRLYRLLRQCNPSAAKRSSVRSLLSCASLLESTHLSEAASDLTAVLKRERRMHHRAAELAAEAKRLEDVREVLQCREVDLRASARRLDEEFARLQTDIDAEGGCAPADASLQKRVRDLEAQLEARTEELERRTAEIAARERMLQEFESMLMSQVAQG